MADTPAPAPAPAKRLPLKVILVVAGIMVAEAAGVYLFVSMTGRAPQDSAAAIQGTEDAGQEALVELPLVNGSFQNMQTGNVWVWKIEVFLKVRKKNEQAVTKELEARSAEIREAVGGIIRRMQHGQLKEPELRTLNRQLSALVEQTFGNDPAGMPRVERVLIAKCEGFATPN